MGIDTIIYILFIIGLSTIFELLTVVAIFSRYSSLRESSLRNWDGRELTYLKGLSVLRRMVFGFINIVLGVLLLIQFRYLSTELEGYPAYSLIRYPLFILCLGVLVLLGGLISILQKRPFKLLNMIRGAYIPLALMAFIEVCRVWLL